MNFLASPIDIQSYWYHLLKNYSFNSFMLVVQLLKTNVRAYFWTLNYISLICTSMLCQYHTASMNEAL